MKRSKAKAILLKLSSKNVILYHSDQKMPKIYEYLGIVIYFYSNEHEPIHVHGQYDGMEVKAELILEDGEIVEIILKSVQNMRPLTGSHMRDFKEFVEKYANEIVAKWVDYFVYHKKIKTEKITRRIG